MTLQYPDERQVMPERFRGFVHNDMTKCDACNICAKLCPVDCIYIESEGKGKERLMTRYAIDYNKCIWCSLCTENCHTGSITMSHDYDHSVYDRRSLVYEFMDPNEQKIPCHRATRIEHGLVGGAQGRQGHSGQRRRRVITDLIFVALALLTVVPAVWVVFSPNIVHAGFALLFTLLGAAGLYAYLGADFIAVTQVMVYVGGVLVLVLFTVMMTRLPQHGKRRHGLDRYVPAAFFSIAVFGLLYKAITAVAWNGVGRAGRSPRRPRSAPAS